MDDVIEQGGISPVSIRNALEERYLAYALSTITQRALPDVRDGLKPVHRRLMYAMRVLNLAPNQPFKKSARVVGDVIGKYHPHGDQAVYEALVRLAQEFAERYPLIEGQGNFGNVDGDSAAAMRYTEARLTEVAILLLDGIDEEAVDFRPTYDASEIEPVVLPGGFPNLLANGAMGIAVGMATSIPPHNICELLDASLHLLDNPKATTDDLMAFVKGPDFPTGGVIIDDAQTIAEAYRTGRGQIRMRAHWEIEKGDRGAEIAVITEIPFMVQKARLIERIAGLMDERKLPMILDVRDESSDDVRVVVEPRTRAVDLTLMMEGLFKATELEGRFSMNMNVLVNGLVPQVLPLHEILKQWLAHLRDVNVRRAQFRLDAVDKRLNILGGLLIVYLDLDRVIKIIREEDEPKAALILAFALNEVQAEAILNTRLRSLRKLEEMALRKEQEALLNEKANLEKLISSDIAQWKKVRAQVVALTQKFTPESALGKRRTRFAAAPDLKQALEDVLVEREPLSVVLSQKGWVRSLKGHNSDVSGLTFKAEDELYSMLCVQSTDKILVFASDGKVFTLDASKLPSGRGFGDPLRLHADLDEMADVVAFCVYGGDEQRFLLATQEGRGFVVKGSDVVSATRRGKQVMNVNKGARLTFVVNVAGDSVAAMGENRKLVVFPITEIPEMGRGQGVRLQRYKDGGLKDISTFRFDEGLGVFDASGQEKYIKDLALWLGHRADAGKLATRTIKTLKRS